MAKASNRPLLVAFLGSSWSEGSTELRKEVLYSRDFALDLLNRVVLCEITLSQDDLTAEEEKLLATYQVNQLPTLALLTSTGDEVCRWEAFSSSLELLQNDIVMRWKLWQEVDHILAKRGLESLSSHELQVLYTKVKTIGNEPLKDKILQVARYVSLYEDNVLFFLLEEYESYVKKGQGFSQEATNLKEEIERLDQENVQGAMLRLALLSYQAESMEKKGCDQRVVVPLLQYVEKFGKKDPDNAWKMQWMVFQYFFAKSKTFEALVHAEKTLLLAPQEEKGRIADTISYIKTHER